MLLVTKMPKLLLVGSGLTAAVTAALLHRTQGSNIDLTIWDKSRGAGGRMATSRSPFDETCTLDLGAQYISRIPRYKELHSKYYEELLNETIIEPMKIIINNANEQDGSEHFVVGAGSSSLVKYYLNQAKVKPLFDHHVSSITLEDGKWSVSTQKGKTEFFDGVVLTMPVPQVFQLGGSVPKLLDSQPELVKKLNSVEYSSRYALGLFYENETDLKLPYSAAYLTDDPVFRFISVDNVKRNRPNSSPSIVLHTSVPFGVEHVEKTVDQVEPILMKALAASFPDLPPPKSVKCHKWRYSQVTQSFEGQPGVVELSTDPLMLLGGDGFTHSNFDGCVSSAEALAYHIQDKMNLKNRN